MSVSQIRNADAYETALERQGRWDPSLPRDLRDGASGAAWAWYEALRAGDASGMSAADRKLGRAAREVVCDVALEAQAAGGYDQETFARRMRSTLRVQRDDANRSAQHDEIPEPETDSFVELAELAARDAWESALDHAPKPEDLKALERLRAEIINTLETSPALPASWGTWARSIISLRWGRCTSEAAESVAAEMSKPKAKEGRPATWSRFSSEAATFEETRALVGKLFSLCGVEARSGYTAQEKREQRARAGVLAEIEIAEGPIFGDVSESRADAMAAHRRHRLGQNSVGPTSA